MLILGLGSNQGDRLAYLRAAFKLIKAIPTLSIKQVSPVYISDALLPENAPVTWDVPYLNLAVRCETQLTPPELLHHTKTIEKEIGRVKEKHWGPRLIDIDILAWEDVVLYDEKLHIPHKQLHERPFALWPLADVAPRWLYPLPGPFQGKTAAEIVLRWGSRLEGNAPLHTKQIPQRIDKPQLVGILNITPDSFSDGGKFLNPSAAIEQLQQLVNTGAEIIDIGAEATGPAAASIDSATEWKRLEPILNLLVTERNKLSIPPKISVDTRHAEIAKKALNLNVDWINDVSGLDDPAMRELLLSHSCDIVLMHHLQLPEDRTICLPLDRNPTRQVYRWAEKRLTELEKLGISRERIIFDAGIGYGKTAEQSLEIINEMTQFHALGTRLLVGHSRKSFLKLFTTQSAAERDIETTIVSLILAKHGVDYLRVHNIDANARALKTAAALLPPLYEMSQK